MNKLRELLDLESDTNKAWAKWMKEMRKKAYEEEDCMTCKHYVPMDPYLPGFCTNLPECKLGGLALEHCPRYECHAARREDK